MSDTLRDRVIAYARAVARNPGWLILPDHAERTIGAPWSEIRDALDALCAEPEPLFRRSRSLVLPNEDDWDANRVPVSDEDLAEAEETGRFYHPGTGEEIEGWRECLWVSYWTTAALRTATDERVERLAALRSDIARRLDDLESQVLGGKVYMSRADPADTLALLGLVKEFMDMTKED